MECLMTRRRGMSRLTEVVGVMSGGQSDLSA